MEVCGCRSTSDLCYHFWVSVIFFVILCFQHFNYIHKMKKEENTMLKPKHTRMPTLSYVVQANMLTSFVSDSFATTLVYNV